MTDTAPPPPSLAQLAAGRLGSRPGSTLTAGAGLNYAPSLAATKQKPPRSLVGQFIDVGRGIPMGLVQLGAKASQTLAAPAHFAYDAIRDPGGLADIDSIGDFTDEYLPLGDMIARSMATTVGRVRHPSRYMRAIEDGTIVGTVLEDVGNFALVGGVAGKALGVAPAASTAAGMRIATEAGAAEGVIGARAAASSLRAAGKIERGSGIAGRVGRAGNMELANTLGGAANRIQYGARLLDNVADAPFPLARYAGGKLGDSLAPTVERIVSDRVGRDYNIPRPQAGRLPLSEVARHALVGTRAADSRVLARVAPQGRQFHEDVAGDLLDNTLRAQMEHSGVGQAADALAEALELPRSRNDPEWGRLTTASTIETQGKYRQQLDGWAKTWAAVAGTDKEATFIDQLNIQLKALNDGAEDATQMLDVDNVRTLLDKRTGRLDPKEAAFIDQLQPAVREMYGKVEQMGVEGIGGRPITPNERGTDVLDIEVNRQRATLERDLGKVDRQYTGARTNASRQQQRAAILQALADDFPEPIAPKDVAARTTETMKARRRVGKASEALTRARYQLRIAYARVDTARTKDAAELAARERDLDVALRRVEDLKEQEAQARARVVIPRRKGPPDQPPPDAPGPGTPPPNGGGGPDAPVAAPKPKPDPTPEPTPTPEPPAPTPAPKVDDRPPIDPQDPRTWRVDRNGRFDIGTGEILSAEEGVALARKITGTEEISSAPEPDAPAKPKLSAAARKNIKEPVRRPTTQRQREARVRELVKKPERLTLPKTVDDTVALSDRLADEYIKVNDESAQLKAERDEYRTYIDDLDTQLADLDARPDDAVREDVNVERQRILDLASSRAIDVADEFQALTGNLPTSKSILGRWPGKVAVGVDSQGRRIYKRGWKVDGRFKAAGGEWDFIERLSKRDIVWLKGKSGSLGDGPDVLFDEYRRNASRFGRSPDLSDAEIIDLVIQLGREHGQLSQFTGAKPQLRAHLLDRANVPESLAETFPGGNVADLFRGDGIATTRAALRERLINEQTDNGRFSTNAFYDASLKQLDARSNKLMADLETLDGHERRLRQTETAQAKQAEQAGALFSNDTKAVSNDAEAFWKWADLARETDAEVARLKARNRLARPPGKQNVGSPKRTTKLSLLREPVGELADAAPAKLDPPTSVTPDAVEAGWNDRHDGSALYDVDDATKGLIAGKRKMLDQYAALRAEMDTATFDIVGDPDFDRLAAERGFGDANDLAKEMYAALVDVEAEIQAGFARSGAAGKPKLAETAKPKTDTAKFYPSLHRNGLSEAKRPTTFPQRSIKVSQNFYSAKAQKELASLRDAGSANEKVTVADLSVGDVIEYNGGRAVVVTADLKARKTGVRAVRLWVEGNDEFKAYVYRQPDEPVTRVLRSPFPEEIAGRFEGGAPTKGTVDSRVVDALSADSKTLYELADVDVDELINRAVKNPAPEQVTVSELVPGDILDDGTIVLTTLESGRNQTWVGGHTLEREYRNGSRKNSEVVTRIGRSPGAPDALKPKPADVAPKKVPDADETLRLADADELARLTRPIAGVPREMVINSGYISVRDGRSNYRGTFIDSDGRLHATDSLFTNPQAAIDAAKQAAAAAGLKPGTDLAPTTPKLADAAPAKGAKRDEKFVAELGAMRGADRSALLRLLGIEIPQVWRGRAKNLRDMEASDVYDGLIPNRLAAGRPLNTKQLTTVKAILDEAGDPNPIVCIACGGQKLDRAAPAGELYTGEPFKRNLAAARAITGGDDSRIYVVSAKNGFVPVAEVVEPYDVTFASNDATDVVSVTRMRQQASSMPDKPVVVLGGKEYVGAVTVSVGNRPVVSPYTGSAGIGQQKQLAAGIAEETTAANTPKPKLAEVAPKVEQKPPTVYKYDLPGKVAAEWFNIGDDPRVPVVKVMAIELKPGDVLDGDRLVIEVANVDGGKVQAFVYRADSNGATVEDSVTFNEDATVGRKGNVKLDGLKLNEPEPAAADGGAGAPPPPDAPTPAAAGGDGGDGGKRPGLSEAADKARFAETRGKRKEAQRQVRIAKDRVGSVAWRAEKLQDRVVNPDSEIGKARRKVSERQAEVDIVQRTADSVEAFSKLTDDEKAIQRAHTRPKNAEGAVRGRSYVEAMNRRVGSANERSSVATARLDRLAAKRTEILREIADLPVVLARPAQAQMRDLIHGRSRSLTLNDQGPTGPIKEGDWIELDDGRWGVIDSTAERPKLDKAGNPVIVDGKVETVYAGWNVDLGGGKTETVSPGDGWRWAPKNSGAVGQLRRALRGLAKPVGTVRRKTVDLWKGLDAETKAELAAIGAEGTYELPTGKGVLWDRLNAAVNRKYDSARPDMGEVRAESRGVPIAPQLSEAEQVLLDTIDDLDLAASDRERFAYLTDNAERLGLDESDLQAIGQSVDIDERMIYHDETVATMHADGSWMDAPIELGRSTEDIAWAPQEYHNGRNQTIFRFKDSRVRAIADDNLNVKAMPARWRPAAQLARRQIGSLLDQAENMRSQGMPDAARELASVAAEIATNIRDLADAGVDPIYIVGGAPSPVGVRVDGINKRPLRADYQRTTPFAPLTLPEAQATQLAEAVQRYRNHTYDIAEQTFGRTVSQVPEMRDWLADFIERNDRYPTTKEYVDGAKALGWTPLDRGKGVGPMKAADRATILDQQLIQMNKDYEVAVQAGDPARIQRVRFQLDELERQRERAVGSTPQALREAWRLYDKARQDLEKLVAQDSSTGPFPFGVDPDKLAAADQAVTNAAAVLAEAEEAAMPKLVPDAINVEMRREASVWDRGMLPGFKLLARTNRAFKTQVLPFSARWYLNNTLGNVLMSAAYGGVSPTALFKELRDLRKGVKLTGVGRRSQARLDASMLSGGLDVGKVRGARATQSGLLESQRRGLGLVDFDNPNPPRTRVGRAVGGAADRGYGVNEFFDNVTRSSVYLAKLDSYARKAVRTGSADVTTLAGLEQVAEAAMRDTLRSMGDYTKMSPFQRKYVRQIFPFWAWIRHSTVAAMRLPMEHPIRTVWLSQMSVLANDEGLSGEELAFFGGRWVLGDGRSIPIGGISPLEDIAQNPILNPAALVRATAPAIKIATAAATGLDLGRLQQVSLPPDERAKGVYGQTIARPLAYNPGSLAGYAIGQFPLLKNVRDVIEGPSVRYGSGEPILDRQGNVQSNGKTRLGSLASIFGIPSPEQVDQGEKVSAGR